jgi:hypothetical protein
MKKFSLIALTIILTSCGGSGGGGGSTNATLGAIKNFRSSLGALTEIKQPASLFMIAPLAAGGDATGSWTTGDDFNYGDDHQDLTLRDWFALELDANKPMTSSGSNFFNRLDIGLMIICALVPDLGENFPEQTKTITATAASINANCGTKLPAANISITGQEAVVTNVVGGAYEKQINVDDTDYFITNSATELKIAYAVNEWVEDDEADRVVFSLNKTTGDFQLEVMMLNQEDGENYPTIYRAFKSGDRVVALGKSPQGTGSSYIATMTPDRIAIDFQMVGGAVQSICLNAQTGSPVGNYGNCFNPELVYDRSDFGAILGYNMVTEVATWTDVDENTVINFTNAASMNSTTF